MASSVKHFLKQSKKTKPNTFYVASENFTDDKGNPIPWEIKSLSTKDNERIKDECTTIIETRDKGFRAYPKIDVKRLTAMQVVASIVFPDLYNAELQDSYGVKEPEELLFAMLDEAGDYQNLVQFVQRFNKLNVTLDEKIEDAKN
jgi:hypothetical protein